MMRTAEKNNEIPQLGRYVFINFIIPLVSEISKYVGAQILYIFALPENPLMKHYKTMGFVRIADSRLERFIHHHVRPRYDNGCIFMYQKIIQIK